LRAQTASPLLAGALLLWLVGTTASASGSRSRPLGPIHVKGRKEQIVVHEVIGLQPAATG